MNISSFSYNFDNLHTFLGSTSLSFDIIGIPETRIKIIILVPLALTLMNISLNRHLLKNLNFIVGIYIHIVIVGLVVSKDAKNVSWPGLSPFRGWDNLAMAFLGKFGYISHHFILPWLNSSTLW